MAIDTSTPNNKQYATLTGTFTGTVDTIFWIRMNNDNVQFLNGKLNKVMVLGVLKLQ